MGIEAADSGTTIVAADAVVGVDTVHRPGWLRVVDGVVDAIGSGAPPSAPDVHHRAGVVVPGFVDTHVHGGGGA